jgi:hypothetical protein
VDRREIIARRSSRRFAAAAFWQFGLRKLDAARNFEIGEGEKKEGSVLESRQNSFGLS